MPSICEDTLLPQNVKAEAKREVEATFEARRKKREDLMIARYEV